MKTGVRALLDALRRAPSGADRSAARSLAPPLFQAATDLLEGRASTGEDLDQLSSELVRVLGAELGEDTPCDVVGAAIAIAGFDGSSAEASARALLTDELAALRAARCALRDAGPAVVDARFISILTDATSAHDRACVLLEASAGSALSPPGHTCSRPRAWDPLDQLFALGFECDARRDALAALLSRTFHPLSIAPAEAIRVASWVLGGPPPRRPGLLSLARSLDDFAERAPLSARDLAQLRALARAADAEREDPAWHAVASRLLVLRPRLLPQELPLPPLYRSRVRGTPTTSTDRTLEGLLST